MISLSLREAVTSVTASPVVGQEALADELLGDRGGAAGRAAEGVDARRR